MSESTTVTYSSATEVFRFTEDILFDMFTLPAFDPSLGNLQGATVDLSVAIATSAYVTDLFGSGVGFAGLDASLNGYIEASFLPTLPIITAIGVNVPQPLVFGSAIVISNGSQDVLDIEVTDLAAVTGTDPLTIEVQTAGVTNPTVNGLYQPAAVDPFAVVSGEIEYTYIPFDSSGNNPPASGAGGSDFNGDGWDDVLFFNAASRSVGQFEMPNGTWSGIGTAGVGWQARGTGLFDSDDTSADILWFNVNTRAVGRFDMVDGADATWSGIGRAGAGWDVRGSGDFNGDGTDDILWFNEASGTLGQYRMSDGAPSWQGIGKTGAGWDIAGIADLNGDGSEDVLWWNAASRSLGQFRMSENDKTWASVAVLGSGFEVAQTGDFDGDGADDILVFNGSTRALGMFDMSGGQATWVSLGTAGAGWSVVGTGDFDASGTDDILWRHSDGRIGQYQMDGASYTWDSIGFAGSEWEVLL